jgi:hypothetical protein
MHGTENLKKTDIPFVSLFRINGKTADHSGNKSPPSINASEFLVWFGNFKLKTIFYHVRCLLLNILQSELIFFHSGKLLRTELSYPSFPYRLITHGNFVQRNDLTIVRTVLLSHIYFRIFGRRTQPVYCPTPPFVYKGLRKLFMKQPGFPITLLLYYLFPITG